MTRILVYARGAVGKTMGSTGVRSYHTARVLAERIPEAQVTLSIPNEPDVDAPHPRLRIVSHDSRRAAVSQVLSHDIIISRNFPPYMLGLFYQKRLVLDFYSALAVEWLEISKRIPYPRRRKVWMASNRHYIDMQLTLADYVVCASERQRDVLIGALSALDLVSPQAYDRDGTLAHLVGIVPYGVQPGSPEHKRRVLKGVLPGIRETDKLLIWNGSIMEWFDAGTVIRAMAHVAQVRDDVKLFFLGTEHPDWVTGLLFFDPPREAVELSKELGLFDRSVFFNVGWVPYGDIGSYLAEADLGVCAGFDNLEARYAYRTRLVDLFWAELPVVCTRGDMLASRIEDDGLGIVVAPGDAQAFAAAILRLLDDEDLYRSCRSNMRAVKEDLSWDRVMAPLVEFCRGGVSSAAPKRRRISAHARRTARYLVTYVRQKRMRS